MSYCDALTWHSTPGASVESSSVSRARAKAAYDARATPASRSEAIHDLMEVAAAYSNEVLGDAIIRAKAFLIALPSNVESPDISVDRDRDIAMEWMNERNDIASVRVAASGRLVYAAHVFGRPTSETLHFSDSISQGLLEVLRAFKK